MWSRKRRPDRSLASPDEAPDQEADAATVSAAGVALLARRDFSSGELAARLRARGFGAPLVAAAIAELAERGYLDDARYAANYVSYHAGRGQGPGHIRRELQQFSVASEYIEAALAEGHDWHRLARETRVRKFGAELPAGWPERARQARFLQYRGFSVDHIRSALGPDFEA